MKNIIFGLLTIFSLTGCIHSGDDPAPSGNVTVKGNVKNITTAWINYVPNIFKNAFAVDEISTRSTLIVIDPKRLDDVSISIGMQVDADVINTTNINLSGYKVDIFVENEQFLTKESWTCSVCYPITNGTKCESLYEIKGDILFESNPTLDLPLCDASTGSPDLCVTHFNDNPDCSSPIYQVDYQPPGDGLWKATINNINIPALSNLLNTVGLQSGGWITGSNKYARFIVYNEISAEIFRKDYVFNVIN